MVKDEFLSLRKKIIENDFKNLNNMQKKAVFSTEGPLLVLAGAGSGKTTVLVNRIANLIKFGSTYYSENFNYNITESEEEMLRKCANGELVPAEIEYLLKESPAKPWQILAITFTNKAANELKTRLNNIIGPEAEEIWASTFHSACVKILRRNAKCIDFSSNFTIYDTSDSKKVIKDCLKQLKLDEKIIPVKRIISEISRAKDYLITPDEYINENSFDYEKGNIGIVYKMYQEKLKESDAMDFDDIIYYTVKLFNSNSDVLEYYQSKFKYILVDEYQDTNHLQYLLISLLAQKYKNICVVGDDDQSIYRFRGATIENILSFESEYRNAKVIRLEQNYRSTQNILDAANSVIANNVNRKGKNLWTDNGAGDKIIKHYAESDRDEAYFVANNILKEKGNGRFFSDFAILYRMNSESNPIEQAFIRGAIPYKIIGGHKFYDRKEIKDAIAYLSVINNPNDYVRMARIINEPKRGIGESSLNSVIEISSALDLELLDVIRNANNYPKLSRTASKLQGFANFIDDSINYSESHKISELLTYVLDESGYITALENDKDLDKIQRQDKLENLDQLVNNITKFEEDNEDATLNDFLQEVSLMTDIDNYNSDDDKVTLMTVHSAKGLEFDTVFLIGMEENIFPSDKSIEEGTAGIEEERRLAYVAITRAKRKLFVSHCKTKVLFGMTRYNETSRFIEEIPDELIEMSAENKRESAKNHSNSSYKNQIGNPEYNKANKTYNKNYDFSGVSSKKPKNCTSFKVGDTVIHKSFGEGVVVAVTPMSNDTMLEVAFLEGQTKKIMANYAKIEKKI